MLNLFLLMHVSLFSYASLTTAALNLPKEPFIFVRHGTTNWHAGMLAQGPKNYNLNKRGRKEAQIAAKIVQSAMQKLTKTTKKFTLIASPLKRAVETAQIISHDTRLSLMIQSGLEERYFGDFSLGEKKICQETGSFVPVDAEPQQKFQSRVLAAMDSIFSDEKTKNSIKIIVSHGKVFEFLSKTLTGKEKVISRGAVVVFYPSSDSWSATLLSTQVGIPEVAFTFDQDQCKGSSSR